MPATVPAGAARIDGKVYFYNDGTYRSAEGFGFLGSTTLAADSETLDLPDLPLREYLLCLMFIAGNPSRLHRKCV